MKLDTGPKITISKLAICFVLVICFILGMITFSNTNETFLFSTKASKTMLIPFSETRNYISGENSSGLHNGRPLLAGKNISGAMQNHIGFLKVHKAGSTTMQNLMFRFGMAHNLTFALPKQGNYLFSKNSAMPLKTAKHYDIFTCHTVYGQGFFSSLLPPDSVNIGIVRDPLERMISGAYYYRDVFGVGYLKTIPKADFILNLINNPQNYEKSPFSFTKNSMGKDFGFSSDIHESDTTRIAKKMNDLQKEFQLVLVMERFEESLVLLKRTLNWHMSDIMFQQTNSHSHSPVSLRENEKAKFRSTCFLDYALYDTFSEIFDTKVAQQGTEFQEEVTFYKSILRNLKEFCDNKSGTGLLEVKESRWNTPFSITKTDCELMTLHEIKFISRLRTRHNQMQT